jgi:arginyl-tRNA synthetase
VGGEQRLHFQQLFKALEMLGHDWAQGCTHVDFGLLLFKDENDRWVKASTRKGRVVMLEDLLDEAVSAVREIIREKNPELFADESLRERVCRCVGVAAVVFNDLRNGRRNDVKFDWDEILNFNGETGPYMLMQYVRMGSVLEKYRERFGEPAFSPEDAARLSTDEEWALVGQLADFPQATARASREMEPSHVARSVIEIASAASTWWNATKDTRIVGDDPLLSRARVRLVSATRRVLGKGLMLLGLSLVERM